MPIKTIQSIKIIVLRHHIYFTILASFIFFFKPSKQILQVDIEVGMMKTVNNLILKKKHHENLSSNKEVMRKNMN